MSVMLVWQGLQTKILYLNHKMAFAQELVFLEVSLLN